MHILFVTSWWPTKENPVNGIFIQEHALAISKYTRVTVAFLNSVEKSTSWKDFPSKQTKTITQLNENLNVIQLNLKMRIRRFGLLERQLNKLISDILKENKKNNPISILHLNVLNSYWPGYLFKKCEQFNTPIVLSEHSSFYHTEIYDLPAWQIEQKKKEITGLLNKPELKYILPVSQQLGNLIANEYHVPVKKVKVIPNIANDVFITSPVSKKMNSQEIVIFAAANWTPPKNPVLFLHLLKRLKESDKMKYNRLKINWAGTGSQLDEIKSISKNELPDLNIHFLGLLTKKEIAEQMSQADFLVHPSDAENLPCIIIESLCTGLPVISAKINGIVELLDESNGKMYTAKNLDDFYQTFMLMLDHLMQFNREKIAATAREKYSSGVIGKEIITIYEKILSV